MFLTSGEHGPYYKLHSFKATDALDTENIKGLRIAGTLRYEVCVCVCACACVCACPRARVCVCVCACVSYSLPLSTSDVE